jgi:nitrate/nitrite transport system ATP-binding protein
MKNTSTPEKANAAKYVQLENIDMTFTTKKGEFNALKNINLSIREGEFI